MSPYPSQVDRETIIHKARELIEAEGLEALSLSKLAGVFGIKAPSLYRYFASKADLLRAVNLLTNQELTAALRRAASETQRDPRAKMIAVAHTYRHFAHAHPITYSLAYTKSKPDTRPDNERLEALVLPIQALVAEISGADNSLTALRGGWALIHGFVMLELNDQFQRGGDIGEFYAKAFEAYLDGWQHPD